MLRGHLAAGSINLLVNNAGRRPEGQARPTRDDEESYDHVVDTNLKGTFFLTQAVARDMIAAKQADARLRRKHR